MKARYAFFVILSATIAALVHVPSADAGSGAFGRSGAPGRALTGIVIPAEWSGIWSSIDSTYDCEGVLQGVGASLDTLCAGTELTFDEAEGFALDCTGSADANGVDMTCTYSEEIVTDCTLTVTFILEGTRTGDSYVVTNTVSFDYAGTAIECGFIPDSCTRTVLRATRIAPEPAAYCATPVEASTWGRVKSQYR
jgi:hypothetical protein